MATEMQTLKDVVEVCLYLNVAKVEMRNTAGEIVVVLDLTSTDSMVSETTGIVLLLTEITEKKYEKEEKYKKAMIIFSRVEK